MTALSEHYGLDADGVPVTEFTYQAERRSRSTGQDIGDAQIELSLARPDLYHDHQLWCDAWSTDDPAALGWLRFRFQEIKRDQRDQREQELGLDPFDEFLDRQKSQLVAAGLDEYTALVQVVDDLPAKI